ncbi:MAG: alkaline phosphatase family protein [Chitinophagaceae bacterium]|nr:alkaline phosphatase family protein [Oligoflexus sp.]
MERRSFLRGSSFLAASLLLPQGLSAQSRIVNNVDALNLLEDKPLRSIAFGSCNKSKHDQSYWSLIGRDQPDLWVWMGDNIYADRTSLNQRKNLYDELKAHPLYQDFRGKTPIIGTWDDHDFGSNNSTELYWNREQSQALFADFIDLPQNALARQQDGVYQTFSFGPVGQRTQIILLDLRYNMNRSKVEKEILGEAQFRWFEETLAASTADLVIVGSSLAVTSNVAMLGLEGWHEFGADRLRLYDALSKTDKPLLILSGDRHYGEIYRTILPSGKIIHEAMASGLTHVSPIGLPHPDKISSTVTKKHYGLLQIDWSGSIPSVNVQLKSAERFAVLTEARTQF